MDPVYGLEEIKTEVRNIETTMGDILTSLGNQYYELFTLSQKLMNIELQNQMVLRNLNKILAYDSCDLCCYYSTGVIKKQCQISQLEISITNNDINYRRVIVEKKFLRATNEYKGVCEEKMETLIIQPGEDKKVIYDLKYLYFSISIIPADSNLDIQVYEVFGNGKKKIDLIKIC